MFDGIASPPKKRNVLEDHSIDGMHPAKIIPIQKRLNLNTCYCYCYCYCYCLMILFIQVTKSPFWATLKKSPYRNGPSSY